MNKADIIIIGGGVSGLTAALRAAFCRTKKIIILEHKSEIGKKLMATGNGRCNFTNEIIDKNSYRGNEPDFAYNIIKQFSQKDLILLFKQLVNGRKSEPAKSREG